MKKIRHHSFQLLLLFIVLLLSGKANAQKEVGVYYSNWFSFPTNWTNTGGCVWAEPALGWYESNDKHVIDQHTEWLVEANVSHPDFHCQKIGSGLGVHNSQYSKSNYWSWEEHVTPGYSMHNGEPECMTVQAALRGTGAAPNVLPQYPDGLPGWLNDGSVFGNYAVPRNNGQTFRYQLDQAIDADVRIILVQSFNEWTGCPHKPGEELDPERSNDIEPMKDGHGDLYIQILKQKTRILKDFANMMLSRLNPSGPLQMIA